MFDEFGCMILDISNFDDLVLSTYLLAVFSSFQLKCFFITAVDVPAAATTFAADLLIACPVKVFRFGKFKNSAIFDGILARMCLPIGWLT